MATAQTQAQAHPQRAREYETIYIMRPAVDPDEADRVANKMSEVVQRLGGKVTKVDNWGKRKLAYPIKKATRGVFVYLKYLGYTEIVAEIERNLRMFDTVVRFQTVQVRDEVDPEQVAVDPEDVKFRRLEITEDEEEPGLEQRLGMIEEQVERRSSIDELDEEIFDDEADLGLDVPDLDKV